MYSLSSDRSAAVVDSISVGYQQLGLKTYLVDPFSQLKLRLTTLSVALLFLHASIVVSTSTTHELRDYTILFKRASSRRVNESGGEP